MYGPAVCVLRHQSLGRKASGIVTPPTFGSTTHADGHILLPAPTDSVSAEYTKPEAVAILSQQTTKGSPLRGKMMRKMIRLAYTPTTERTLSRLMKSHADGEIIPTDAWGGNCKEKVTPRPLPTQCVVSDRGPWITKLLPTLNIVMQLAGH